MTLVYRDPTLLASTLTPLVDLADKIVRLQHKLDPESVLHAALKAAEERIAEHISKVLPAASEAFEPIKYDVDRVEPVEGDAVQTLKVGDRVRIARAIDIGEWLDEMDETVGSVGTIAHIDEPATDDVPVLVRFPRGERFYYPLAALEKVSDRTTKDGSK